MTNSMSLRHYFAAHAPEVVPDWFDFIQPPDKEPTGLVERAHQQTRFFAWRWYYADLMLQTENAK